MEPPQNVAIIGAGLAGLSLAVALHKVAIPCTVYESRSESYDIGGGITLSPNALRILDKLGVYERMKDRGFHFDRLSFSDGDGNVKNWYYFGSQELYGYPAFRIIRRLMILELQTMLRETKTPIHFNRGFTRVVAETGDGVEFELTDGSTAKAAVLIGADGIHSTVRDYVAPGTQPVYSGFTAINCTCPRAKLRIPNGFHLPATVMAKPGAFLMVPQEVDGSELLIGAQRKFPEQTRDGWANLLADKQGLLDMLRENKDDWPDIVQSALEGAPLENMGLWAFYMIPKLDKWASVHNRVILVGDSAHAIPPTAGQGVNQAFEDINMLAVLLSRLSPKTPLPDALHFWQTYRQERVDKILALTNAMNAKRLPPAEQAKLPPGSIWSDDETTGADGKLRWLYEPDLDKDVERWLAGRT